MTIDIAYFTLLVVSLSLMLAQLFIKQKRLEHIFFAIFCGSLAMVAVKFLGTDLLGPYRYIVGLFTSATCNVIWLVSRAMFRGESAIQMRHILFASLIALLVMCSQGIKFAAELSWLGGDTLSHLQSSISEFTQLISSTVLLLTFWEALRPNAKQNKTLRYVFATSYASAVLASTVGLSAFVDASDRAASYPWFVVLCALQVVLVTQFVQYRQKCLRDQGEDGLKVDEVSTPLVPLEVDDEVIVGINKLLINDKPFLQHNLKMIDFANALGVSEYKISRAIRYHFKARNFNHFINAHRIEHAKSLLENNENGHWSILVVGLESGFSSLASFNRAFKALEGCSPNTYRSMQDQSTQAV